MISWSRGVAEKNLLNRDKSPASYTSWFRSRDAPAATGPRDDSSPSRGAERRVKGRKAPSQRGIPGEINTASEGPGVAREEREEARRASSSIGPRGRFLMPVFREAVDRSNIWMSYEERTHIERPRKQGIPNENGSGKPSPPPPRYTRPSRFYGRRIM